MSRYIKREDAVFAACKVLDKFGGCKMGALCPDVGCVEVRDIIDTFNMIEIPDQHGRLIDADALAEHKFVCIPHVSINGKDAGTAYRLGWNTAIEAVMENAETIIGGE